MVRNRKFILVECEDYADTITAERVRVESSTGVPNARDDSLREGLGGSFTYCTLGEPLEIEGMLTGDALPSMKHLPPICCTRLLELHITPVSWSRKTVTACFTAVMKWTIVCSTNPILNTYGATKRCST